MIPTEEQAKALWDKYHLPEKKRIHVALVAKQAMIFAKKIKVNKKLLFACALLHDIDNAVEKLPEEVHPDTAVRILQEEGMGEVANIVASHSLHSILDSNKSPKTWEEKLLYLADKMVKYEIIGVDNRFDLWRSENLSPQAKRILEKAYPKVKALEKEVLKFV